MVCAFITSGEYQRRFSPVLTHINSECQAVTFAVTAPQLKATVLMADDDDECYSSANRYLLRVKGAAKRPLSIRSSKSFEAQAASPLHSNKQLGEFLRVKRESLLPKDVGIATIRRRELPACGEKKWQNSLAARLIGTCGSNRVEIRCHQR